VIDEVAGMLVALSFVAHEIMAYLGAFVLFRLFDIWKPWPISWADKNIKGGFGILLDDLIAGLFAGGIIYALFSFT
jgi:phosphatidylglycerophosphatase A